MWDYWQREGERELEFDRIIREIREERTTNNFLLLNTIPRVHVVFGAASLQERAFSCWDIVLVFSGIFSGFSPREGELRTLEYKYCLIR